MPHEPMHHYIRRTARAAAKRIERGNPAVDAVVIKLRHGRYRYVVRYRWKHRPQQPTV